MRIETHHIFKVNAFATQVKIKNNILYKLCNILFLKIIVPLFECIEQLVKTLNPA